MIEAVIFDMDGLLIDSEPLWHRAEIAAAKLVDIYLTKEECLETTGLRSDKIIEHWYLKKPWSNLSKEEVKNKLVENLISLVNTEGKEKAGTHEILEFMKKKKVKIALASSSQMSIINAATDKLGIKEYFEELYSAEFEEHGKPHPGVYLTTAKALDVSAERCLTFEDSLNGLLSAKSARMKCVVVPDESIMGSHQLSIADMSLSSLKEFNEKSWLELNK